MILTKFNGIKQIRVWPLLLPDTSKPRNSSYELSDSFPHYGEITSVILKVCVTSLKLINFKDNKLNVSRQKFHNSPSGTIITIS